MLKRLIQSAIIVLLLSSLNAGNAYAKGAPARMTIQGPGIPDVLEITDVVLLAPFGWGDFADFSSPIEARDNMKGGYVITRYVLMGGTIMRNLDRLIYYPGFGDEGSIVFYEGIIDKKFIYGGSPHDGKWFRVSDKGEIAIQQIFDAHGISPKGNTPLILSSAAYNRSRTLYSLILAVTSAAILVLARWKWLVPQEQH